MKLDLAKPLETNQARYPNVTVTNEGRDWVEARYSSSSGEGSRARFNIATGVMEGHEQRDDQLRLRNKSEEVANHYFRVWFGRDEWTKDMWRYAGNDREYQFTDPKEAAAMVKQLNEESKAAAAAWRFMVKPHTEMSPNHKWREWMIFRFETNQYGKLPWADEPWVNPDHFAHPSLADPFKIAFVKDDVAGVADKMTVMTPGSYLQTYFSKHLTPQQIAQWACKVDTDAELKFADTPDEIERIYTSSGISSCMAYNAGHFPARIHPTRIYGAGDLRLAYLERRGKVVARALVYPKKMIVQRIYGDVDRIRPRLEAEGYTIGDGSPEKFFGARLLRIQVGREMVMPYLDWSLQAKDNPDGSDTLVLCGRNDGQYSGGSTNGIASGRTVFTCGNDGCGRSFSGEDSGSLYYAEAGRHFCPSCARTHLRTCMNCDGNYRHDGTGSTSIAQLRTSTGALSKSTWVCSQCVGSGVFVRHETGIYRRAHTTVHNGVRIPNHLLAVQASQSEVIA